MTPLPVQSGMLRSHFPAPVHVVLSLYLPYVLFIPDRQDTNACTSFRCTSDTWRLQYQPRLSFCPLQVPGEGVQHSSHQQRVQDTPCQLIQLPVQQADRKDESWKAKKEEKKQEGQRERREEGEGECPTAWITISHWRRHGKSRRHSTLGWQKDAGFSLESVMKVINLKSSYCKGLSLDLDKKTGLVSYTQRRRLCKVWLTFSHMEALLYRPVSHMGKKHECHHALTKELIFNIFFPKVTALSTVWTHSHYTLKELIFKACSNSFRQRTESHTCAR